MYYQLPGLRDSNNERDIDNVVINPIDNKDTEK